MTTKQTLGLIAVLLALYLLAAWFQKWFPFNTTTPATAPATGTTTSNTASREADTTTAANGEQEYVCEFVDANGKVITVSGKGEKFKELCDKAKRNPNQSIYLGNYGYSSYYYPYRYYRYAPYYTWYYFPYYWRWNKSSWMGWGGNNGGTNGGTM